jgi:hypothetical protein
MRFISKPQKERSSCVQKMSFFRGAREALKTRPEFKYLWHHFCSIRLMVPSRQEMPQILISLSAMKILDFLDLRRALKEVRRRSDELSISTHVAENGTVFHIEHSAETGDWLVYLDSETSNSQHAPA